MLLLAGAGAAASVPPLITASVYLSSLTFCTFILNVSF